MSSSWNRELHQMNNRGTGSFQQNTIGNENDPNYKSIMSKSSPKIPSSQNDLL